MTLTVAQLAARAHRDVGYVLFLEGCPFAFTDRAELAGEGEFSWLGESVRSIYLDLQVPETLVSSSSPETGMLEDVDGATFVVQDFSRRLIAFVADQDSTSDTIGQRLSPTDDPAPATLLSADGQTSIDIRDRYVGVEAIGTAGQRRQWQVHPGDPLPGYDHASVTSDVQDIAPVVVRDAATHLVGRRAALYRIFRDTTAPFSTWPSWSDHDASGYSRLWEGTVTEVKAQGLTWSIVCDGPSALLRKTLGGNRPAEWKPCRSRVVLSQTPGAREDLFALGFYYEKSETPFGILKGGASAFDLVDDTLPATGSLEQRLTAIKGRINVVSAITDDVDWSTHYSGVAAFELGYAGCKIADSGYKGAWVLCMHERVWAQFGYDWRAQSTPSFFSTSDYEVLFMPADKDGGTVTINGVKYDTPGPGYVTAIFHTVPLGSPFPPDFDNGGKLRKFLPISPSAAEALRPEGDQEIVVGSGPTVPYLEGQLARPADEHAMTFNGGDCDTTGFVALRGPYRESGDEEPRTQVQIAKVSWHNDSSLGGVMIGQDDLSERAFFVARYIDPRWFGINRKLLDRTWATNALEWVPVNVVGYNLDAGDRADLVMLRTMLSTGTASWSDVGPGAVRTLGDNAHPDATIDEGSDVEIADLGLGIYHGLIDWQSFIDTANELPEGGVNSPLNRVKIAHIGPFDSQELISRIIEPRGWALGWSGGRFRLFNRPGLLSFEDAEVTISSDDYASQDIPYMEEVAFGELTPKDLYRLRYGGSLVDDAGPDNEPELTVRAQDPGRPARAGNADLELDAQGLINTGLWTPGEPGAPSPWYSAAISLWGRIMSVFFAAPHVKVSGLPILYSKAKDIGVGTVVRFTSSPFAPSREGSYGLAAKMARVYKVEHNLLNLTSKLDLLVQPGDPLAFRRWAPIAVVLDDVATVEARYDVATRTLSCYDDFFGREYSTDVAYFAEPAWLGVGGDAKVHGYQWNGRAWAQTFSFDVESVDTAAHTITWKVGTFSGTFHEVQYTVLVLAPWDDQDVNSWPRSLFSVHTDSTFMFGAGPTKGFKLL